MAGLASRLRAAVIVVASLITIAGVALVSELVPFWLAMFFIGYLSGVEAVLAIWFGTEFRRERNAESVENETGLKIGLGDDE